ncbi:MAG: preprotein translocase subunit SecG [Defluviitaleaceae bacterium]|nr:preprotein translocase subunit SecG [Defluviitaleaceae bacterium]
MSWYFIVLDIIFGLVCVGLMACILLQKKRSDGLGSIAGMANVAESYWDKNKGNSMEGRLEKYTKIGGVIFFVASLGLCLIK